jgi:hypothetical protein
MTSLAIGAITPKTRENTTFLMAQELKRCKTRVLEAPKWNSAAGARHPLGFWENNDLARKSEVLLGFWSLLGKAGGCRRLKN